MMTDQQLTEIHRGIKWEERVDGPINHKVKMFMGWLGEMLEEIHRLRGSYDGPVEGDGNDSSVTTDDHSLLLEVRTRLANVIALLTNDDDGITLESNAIHALAYVSQYYGEILERAKR